MQIIAKAVNVPFQQHGTGTRPLLDTEARSFLAEEGQPVVDCEALHAVHLQSIMVVIK